MKNQIILALALLISTFSFSQKKELKDAEKAIKDNNFAEAKMALSSAEGLVANEDDKTKAQFYFLKGQAFYANGSASDADMKVAIGSFDNVTKIEDGKGKYSDDVAQIKGEMLSKFLTAANTALESKQYMVSSANFEKAYRMSPKDTLYLYYAASTAVTAQDYEKSLQYYNELMEMDFDGYEMKHTAINKETSEVETFANKALRDAALRSGAYFKPEDVNSGSKKPEIAKNVALIYVSNGENEKAIQAMKAARAENPDDFSLLISEANVHLQLGDRETFKQLIEEATKMDPNNAELQYNLGVIAAEAGDTENAKKYYENTIKLDPSYSDAYNNLAVLILENEQKIIEEMNSLGSSAADNKRYDELKKERADIYAEAAPYLEKTIEINPNNLQASMTLMNIYSALGEMEKFKAMKEKVNALEAEQK